MIWNKEEESILHISQADKNKLRIRIYECQSLFHWRKNGQFNNIGAGDICILCEFDDRI